MLLAAQANVHLTGGALARAGGTAAAVVAGVAVWLYPQLVAPVMTTLLLLGRAPLR